MKNRSLLRPALFLVLLPLLLIGCSTAPYYAVTKPDPATIHLTGKSVWSGEDWNDQYGLPRDAKVKPMILLEMVDGLQLNPKMGFAALGPWKIDGGKHRVQLAVNESNGLFRGTFELVLEPGRTYSILAVRNSKIANDGAGAVVGLLTEIRTRGVLVERQPGDARDYYYQLKLFVSPRPSAL